MKCGSGVLGTVKKTKRDHDAHLIFFPAFYSISMVSRDPDKLSGNIAHVSSSPEHRKPSLTVNGRFIDHDETLEVNEKMTVGGWVSLGRGVEFRRFTALFSPPGLPAVLVSIT